MLWFVILGMRVVFQPIQPRTIITYWFQVQSSVCTGILVVGVSNRKWDCVVPVLRYTEYQCTTLINGVLWHKQNIFMGSACDIINLK